MGSLGRLKIIGWAATAVVLGTALTGCSDEASVSKAQAEVTAKEQALADAQAAAKDAKAGFCSATATYVTALDRYGDLLVSTTPTVADVTTAGSDLVVPREEAMTGAQEAITAHEAVSEAEAELAAAQAGLASLTASEGTSDSGTPKDSGSVSPTGAPAQVTRVQQAEADFAAAQAGISGSTPLVKAGVQFNSAAVALEAAWLQLLGQSGCLSESAQEDAVAAVSDYVSAVQEDLDTAGYYDGDVDGVYGPDTVAAIKGLQQAHGLAQTGTVDKATDVALQQDLAEKGQASAREEASSTAALQQTLKLAGYWDGPVDGQWTPELTAALEELQQDLGVAVTGTVDPATISAFEEAVEQAMTPETATATATATKTKTATATATATKTATETATASTTTTASTTATVTVGATTTPTPTPTASPSDTLSP